MSKHSRELKSTSVRRNGGVTAATEVGQSCNIEWYSTFSYIGGGQNNQVNASFSSFIGGGTNNVIQSICNSFIGGGDNNFINGGWCAGIGAGQDNTLTTPNPGMANSYSGIFSGHNNAVSTFWASFIGGGDSNFIGNSTGGVSSDVADWGVIGGGKGNTISSNGNSSPYNVIGGGQGNTINPGVNHGAILGGTGNNIFGNCSAILGGSGNNDGGLNNVFIAGSGITGVLANTTHVNALWASAIPNCPGGVGAVLGQIYWDTPGAPGKALYIK